VRVMVRDDVYPVKTFKVGLLHYFIAELGVLIQSSKDVQGRSTTLFHSRIRSPKSAMK